MGASGRVSSILREHLRFLTRLCLWQAMTLTANVLALTAKLLSGSSVRWVDCQPDTCQRIYFANHTSHLDALVLWSSLPKHVFGR